jgi:hypothetical protein
MPWSSAWLLSTPSYDGAVTGVGSIVRSNNVPFCLLSNFFFYKENFDVIYRCAESNHSRNEMFMNASG